MNKSPAFQFYPKDFLADLDVDDMTPRETGMFIILLCHCWLQKGLKSSSRLVQRYFKLSPTVAAQFYEKGGRFYNTRLDLEEKNQEFRRKKAQEGGLKSAENKRLNKYSSSIVQPEFNTPSSSSSPSSINILSRESMVDSRFPGIHSLWNEFATEHNLAQITGIKNGTTRYRHLKERMKEKDFDFPKILAIIKDSPFLLGQSKEPFFITFDWLICPSNFDKVKEGNYFKRESKYQPFGIKLSNDEKEAT